MLGIRGLVKRFGDTVALAGLDLAVARGDVYCLLGPNGAGKSTTIGALLGFVAPDAGSVAVDGIDPAREPMRARALLAYVPEQVALYPFLSGDENLAYFSRLAGVRESRQRRREHLSEAGLAVEAHDRAVGGYSKGMRQRVALAIARAKGARALLLDEPTSGLDPSAAEGSAVALRALADTGVAVLVATHDLLHARRCATRIGILARGRLCVELPTAGLGIDELQARYHAAVAPSA